MVKCSECGFLTVRRQSGELESADERYRVVGGPVMGGQYYQVPLCFMRVLDFRNEFKKKGIADPEHPGEDDIRKVITEQRECKEWTTWQFGFTPKEHREMMDRERMLAREATESKETRRLQRLQAWLALATVIIAVLGILVGAAITLRAALIQRDSRQPINNIIQLPAQPTPSTSDTVPKGP